MPYALNIVVKVKQDLKSQIALQNLKQNFTYNIQPKIDAIFQQCQIIHFSQIFVIDDKYLVLNVVYDQDIREYSEFFRSALSDVFAIFFALDENAPNIEMFNDPIMFYQFMQMKNVPALGESSFSLTGINNKVDGYLFSAYGSRSVIQVLHKLD